MDDRAQWRNAGLIAACAVLVTAASYWTGRSAVLLAGATCARRPAHVCPTPSKSASSDSLRDRENLPQGKACSSSRSEPSSSRQRAACTPGTEAEWGVVRAVRGKSYPPLLRCLAATRWRSSRGRRRPKRTASAEQPLRRLGESRARLLLRLCWAYAQVTCYASCAPFMERHQWREAVVSRFKPTALASDALQLASTRAAGPDPGGSSPQAVRPAEAASSEVSDTQAAQGDAGSAAAGGALSSLDGPPARAVAAGTGEPLSAPHTEMPDAAQTPDADAAPDAADEAVGTVTEGAGAADLAPLAGRGAQATSGSGAVDSKADQCVGQDGRDRRPGGAVAMPDEATGEASKGAAEAGADAGGTHGGHGAGDFRAAAESPADAPTSISEQRATGVQQARLRAEAAMAESVLAHVRRSNLRHPGCIPEPVFWSHRNLDETCSNDTHGAVAARSELLDRCRFASCAEATCR